MNKVVVVPILRMGSERLHNKMTWPIAGKPLAYRSLQTIRDACVSEGVDCRAGIWVGDGPLVGIISDLSITPLWRTEASVRGETCEAVYDETFREQLRDWEWCIVACCCSPFIPLEVYATAIAAAKVATRNGVSAFKCRGWVWNEAGERVIGENDMNTKTSPVYYVPAHLFNVVRVSTLGTPVMFADAEPIEVPRSPETQIHVDTPSDMRMAEVYARAHFDATGYPA
jgi:hypothetical protein